MRAPAELPAERGSGEPAGPGPAARWSAHRYNRAVYYRIARAVARGLPEATRTGLAVAAGRLLVPAFPVERAAVRTNLVRVHPGRDGAWVEATARRLFRNFAVCFADLLALGRAGEARLRRLVAAVEGEAHVAAALAGGGGAVFVTAHLGNWALASRLLARFGRRVHVVMAPEPDPGIAAVVAPPADGLVRVVRRDGPLAPLGLVAALRRGELVAFQFDRPSGTRGDRRVAFFGAPAAFPTGPVLLAARAGAPVLASFCVLGADGRYRLFVEPPLLVARGGEAAVLDRLVAVLERYVAAYSDQWFNFFDVWEAGAAGADEAGPAAAPGGAGTA